MILGNSQIVQHLTRRQHEKIGREMKILKVLNCGGCGESKFDSEFDSTGWCMRSDRGIRRYELPNWCPLEDEPEVEE